MSQIDVIFGWPHALLSSLGATGLEGPYTPVQVAVVHCNASLTVQRCLVCYIIVVVVCLTNRYHHVCIVLLLFVVILPLYMRDRTLAGCFSEKKMVWCYTYEARAL